MNNSKPYSTKRQLNAVNKKLAKLKDDITPDDRLCAIETLGLSRQAISKYLNNKAGSLQTGTALLIFFSRRIAERKKEIQNA